MATPPTLVLTTSEFQQKKTNVSTEPLRHLLSTTEVSFSGALRYTDSGHIYMEQSPEEPQYFGPPSSAVDAAWADLTAGDVSRGTWKGQKLICDRISYSGD